MSSKVSLITPDSEEFIDMMDAMELSSKAKNERADYNALARIYNEAPIGSFMVLEDTEKQRAKNIIVILQGRGIRVPEDAEVTKPTRNNQGVIPVKDRRIVVKKVSKAKMNIIGK
jgi:hypothetical protein